MGAGIGLCRQDPPVDINQLFHLDQQSLIEVKEIDVAPMQRVHAAQRLARKVDFQDVFVTARQPVDEASTDALVGNSARPVSGFLSPVRIRATLSSAREVGTNLAARFDRENRGD